MSRFEFIQAYVEPWPVQVLCRVLGISCADYYHWHVRAQPTPAPRQVAAQVAFTRHARRSDIRLRAELRAEGHAAGRCALHS